MSLSAEDIKRIAYLARIEISEDDVQASLHKLSGILGLIEEMQAVDTSGITRLGLPDGWVYQDSRAKQLAEVGLDAAGIARAVRGAVAAEARAQSPSAPPAPVS